MGELKPGWRRVKFGELAECINDRVDDPSQAGVDRYVGLEHLDSESLRIRRWGRPGEVESTKLRFRVGDIIFGKRRAYQRKLAVADFEGICSAHAMVLRAKPGVVAPEFLPFFMQSDTFMERAVKISVGSLSPTINWKTLAVQEFALPPIEEQRRVTHVLRHISNTSAAAHGVAEATAMVHRSAINHQMRAASPRSALLDDLCILITDGEHATPPRTLSGVYLLSARNISDHGLALDHVDYISEQTYTKLAKRVEPRLGDVLLSCSGSIGRVCPVPDGAPFAFVRSVALLRPDPEILDHEYLTVYLQSPYGQRQIRALTNQTAQGNLFQGSMKRISVPVPSRSVQLGIVETWKAGNATLNSVKGRAAELSTFGRGLLEQMLQDSP